jgi:hypothetical protein
MDVMSDPEAKTQPLPTIQSGRPDDVVVVQRPPRRKRRGLAAVIAVIVVLALIVAAFFVGDYFARKAATNYVAQQAATAAGLNSTRGIHVNLGKGYFLLQAISGRINDVTVTIDPLTVQHITGSLTITAHGVPVDTTQPVNSLQVQVTVPVSSIAAKVSTLPQLKKIGVRLTTSGQHLVFSIPFTVFGQKIPIGITATPGVKAGKATLAIDGIELGQNRIPAAQLNQIVPGLSSLLASGQSLCIASALPKELVLRSITVQGKSLHFTLDGNGAKLDHASLSARGSC